MKLYIKNSVLTNVSRIYGLLRRASWLHYVHVARAFRQRIASRVVWSLIIVDSIVHFLDFGNQWILVTTLAH